MGVVSVTLFDDRRGEQTNAVVADPLAGVFSYSPQWAQKENKQRGATLTFSSIHPAMIAGADPLCGWLRSHLALRGVRSESMTNRKSFSPERLPDVFYTTISFRRALAKARELCLNESHDGLAVRHFM